MLKQEVLENASYITNSFEHIEVADDNTRAIITIPLFHYGPNKKGLFWTVKMLKKVALMFRGVPFRYDIGGQEGSSHTLKKLSSPHFDVGWTYSSEAGAWYDSEKKVVFVKGEVTHPDVISKLERMTSDGKREVNFASMGVFVQSAVCSICGSKMGSDTCEHEHVRMEKYEGKTCYRVPTEVSKALHVALTNDPADGEAEIKNVLFQDCSDYNMGIEENRKQLGSQMETTNQLSNQIPTGLAPEASTAIQGDVPSPEVIIKDLAERVKTLEGKMVSEVTPEIVNDSPMADATEAFNITENKMEQPGTIAQPPAPAVAQAPADPMSQMMGLLKQILAKLGGTEVQDMGKEALSVSKGSLTKPQDNIPTSSEGGEAVTDSDADSNKKNKANMNSQGKIATADNNDYAAEFADMKARFDEMSKTNSDLRAKLEIQDNSNIPEFGGSNKEATPDIADMGAEKMVKTFGEAGAWEACFR